MYKTLYYTCTPPSAITSNRKFITPKVQPAFQAPPYIPLFNRLVETPKSVCNTKKQPRKPQSKDPTNWGPHLWYYLHTSAANYPENPSPEQQHNMKQWLITLSTTIPCTNCSGHYSSYINKHRNKLDDICSDKHKLFDFLVDCHNQVNIRNKKPHVSYEEARKIFPVSNSCSTCTL
jgi:hypothetical protein